MAEINQYQQDSQFYRDWGGNGRAFSEEYSYNDLDGQLLVMNDHPNKHIRAAVDYAMDHGWTLRKGGPRAHVWRMLYCPRHDRTGCIRSVFSTPRVPESHAKDIRRAVDRCQHGEE